MTRRAGLVLLALGLTSCADLQAPDPVVRPAPAHRWEVPPSFLVVPVRVSQAPWKAWSESAVPTVLKGEGTGQRTLSAWFLKHDWHYWWTYELRRAPLAVAFGGNTVRVGASLTGDLSARWDTLPGDISSEVEADAGVEAVLVLGPDWKVVPRTQVFLDIRRADVPIGIAWDGNFFGETISIAAPVREALKPSLESLGKELDRRLGGVELKPAVDAVWKDLQEPRAVAGAEVLWLALGPRSVGVGPVEATADFVGVTLTVEVHPELRTGPRPTTTISSLLTPSKVSPASPGLVLNLPLAYPWEGALARSRSRWQIKEPWAVGNGAHVAINTLTAQSNGDRVALRVEATLFPVWPGPKVQGILWLDAQPQWDPVTRTLRLVHLTLDGQTKEYLAKTAPWATGTQWLNSLQEALVWDLGPDLNTLRDRAASALTELSLGPRLSLGARLDALEVVDFAVVDRGIEVLARISGPVSVSWGTSPPP